MIFNKKFTYEYEDLVKEIKTKSISSLYSLEKIKEVDKKNEDLSYLGFINSKDFIKYDEIDKFILLYKEYFSIDQVIFIKIEDFMSIIEKYKLIGNSFDKYIGKIPDKDNIRHNIFDLKTKLEFLKTDLNKTLKYLIDDYSKNNILWLRDCIYSYKIIKDYFKFRSIFYKNLLIERIPIQIENGFILGANLKENFSGSIYTRTGIDLYNLFIVSSSKNMKGYENYNRCNNESFALVCGICKFGIIINYFWKDDTID